MSVFSVCRPPLSAFAGFALCVFVALSPLTSGQAFGADAMLAPVKGKQAAPAHPSGHTPQEIRSISRHAIDFSVPLTEKEVSFMQKALAALQNPLDMTRCEDAFTLYRLFLKISSDMLELYDSCTNAEDCKDNLQKAMTTSQVLRIVTQNLGNVCNE